MAGIGFLLRKLVRHDDFSGIIRAYFHAAIGAVGPWILIVLTLGAISFFTASATGTVPYFAADVSLVEEVGEFQAIILYNVFFSFILASPLYVLSARYVADCLYRRDSSPVPGILISSLVFLLIPATLISSAFYLFYATLNPLETVLSIVNFVLFAEIWLVMLYLSAIRNFRAITISWVTGMILTVFLAINLGQAYALLGLLVGLNLGLVLLLFSLKANILAEYPYRYSHPKNFGFYFSHYKGLFWSGLFLFGGLWIDKVLMWTVPDALVHKSHLRTYPLYDEAMFLSYLTIIPVMALFIFSLETNFYESYIRYIKNIENNATLALIEEDKKTIITRIIENGRSFIILQGSVSLIVILLAPNVLEWLGIDFLELTVFRLGVLGAFFAALNLIIVVFFSYFDSQENMLWTTGVMIVSNIVLTLLSQQLGFIYYGYGFALSMMISFFVGAMLFARLLKNLTYHIFISNVVKRHTFE